MIKNNLIILEEQRVGKHIIKSFLIDDFRCYGIIFISKIYDKGKEIVLDCINIDQGKSIHLPVFNPINKGEQNSRL